MKRQILFVQGGGKDAHDLWDDKLVDSLRQLLPNDYEIRFPTDLDARLPKDVPIHLWHGLDDDIVPPAHVHPCARAIPRARVHHLRGRDHQFNNELSDIAAAILSLEARC